MESGRLDVRLRIMEVAVALALSAVVLAWLLARWFSALRKSGSDYVYVENDGSVRDPTPDEIEYLDTEFLANDGNRPYVKGRYRQLTPDGSLNGFLPRRKVPRRLKADR